RRHTRWPRDWSSDVCSSDLAPRRDEGDLALSVLSTVCHKTHGPAISLRDEAGKRQHVDQLAAAGLEGPAERVPHERLGPIAIGRSEERRVGKEGGRGGARDL